MTTNRRMQALYSANKETSALYALINGHGDDLNTIIKSAEFDRAMRLGITLILAIAFIVVGCIGSIAMNKVTFREGASYIIFSATVLVAGWIKMRPKIAFIDGYADFVEKFKRTFHIDKFPPCFQYAPDEVRMFIHRELLEKMRWALFAPTQPARDSSKRRFNEIQQFCQIHGLPAADATDYENSFAGHFMDSVVDTDRAMRQLMEIIAEKRQSVEKTTTRKAG